MTSDEQRQDPDLLLKAISRLESTTTQGHLRVFLGMCAGVGKTYAMLEAAQVLLREGIHVEVGFVETHGRIETEALVKDLTVIPRLQIKYRDKSFEDMDLETILQRKPNVVLVDELAHTNVVGMRHKKRWQDVDEILSHGIDVYTTLNIQHVESRKEEVERVAGITIHELVPDSILERADQIELVDLPPAILLERLKEGKVYLEGNAKIALDNFFKSDRLTALREISLRLTSDIVSNELRDMTLLSGEGNHWRPHERVLVAVSHSPHSKRLVRAVRKIAFSAGSPWIALHVDNGHILSDEDAKRLADNLELARELGGEVMTTMDTDIVSAIKRTAQQQQITKIIIGRPRPSLMKRFFQVGTILDRLVRETNIDVHVLKEDPIIGKPRKRFPLFRFQGNYLHMLYSLIGVTLLNFILVPYLGYQSIGFIYLLAVMVISMLFAVGPLIIFTLSSALIWDYFFIPPMGTLFIRQPADFIMCFFYGFTALVIGLMAHRIRERGRLLRLREERTNILYSVVKTLAASTQRETCINDAVKQLNIRLTGTFGVFYIDKLGLKELKTSNGNIADNKQLAVVNWVFENNQPAGWSTDTLSLSSSFYLPLKGPSVMTGVLSYMPNEQTHMLTPDEKNLLIAIATQLAIYLETDLYQQRSMDAEKLEESERLHQTILNSISHELKTPMTAILGLSSALESKGMSNKPDVQKQLLDELSEAVDRLNREVSNILDMSRLSSGHLTLKKEWTDIREIITSCLSKLDKQLIHHPIHVNVPEEDIPYVKLDYGLFETALKNIIINSATYTPEGAPITITQSNIKDCIQIVIADLGPGVPEDLLHTIFDKFYRVPGSEHGGTGLGLTIAKAVIEAHGGTIQARNQVAGGLDIIINLPLETQPEIPKEEQ